MKVICSTIISLKLVVFISISRDVNTTEEKLISSL